MFPQPVTFRTQVAVTRITRIELPMTLRWCYSLQTRDDPRSWSGPVIMYYSAFLCVQTFLPIPSPSAFRYRFVHVCAASQHVSTTGHFSNTGSCDCTFPYYSHSWSAARTCSNSWYLQSCRENVVPTELRCHQLLDFRGVTLDNLVVLEQVFSLNVYVLQETEAGDIAARLVRRSPYSFEDTMNLNMCELHFSYVSNMEKYSHS
jgi:hypothetical protein